MSTTVTNLLPELAKLHRQDKLFIIQFLASALSQQEPVNLRPGAEYPVWTPLDAHDAASVLKKMLTEDKQV